jgi:putative transposase
MDSIYRAMNPFESQSRLRITRRHLPHWRQDGRIYFVTSRLIDSLPLDVAEDWRRKRDDWLRQHGAMTLDDLGEEFRLEYQRQFSDRFHELLDAGYGSCVLARHDCASILTCKMIEGHSTCFLLGPWVVMPNHMHALVEPAPKSVLGEIVQHWKGGSSFAINRLLGRRGTLWQSEPWDHIVRSEAHWQHLAKYIASNPESAHVHRGYVRGCGAEVGLTKQEVLTRCGLES